MEGVVSVNLVFILVHMKNLLGLHDNSSFRLATYIKITFQVNVLEYWFWIRDEFLSGNCLGQWSNIFS